MTTTQAPPHTPPRSRGARAKQATRAARSRRSGWAVLRVATWPIETAAWAAARAIVRYPKSAAALGAALPLVSPVTYREIAGVFLAGSTVVGVGSFAGRASQRVGPSLAVIAKFRQRKARVRRRWVTVMTDAGLSKTGVNGSIDKRRPRLLRVTRDPLGVSLLVDGSRVSAGVDTFLGKADVLRAGFRCRDVKVLPAGHNVRLRLRFEDPFNRTINFAELPKSTKTLHVTVGLDEDGEPVEKDFRLPHLVCGASGAGKSSEAHVVLKGLVESGIPFRLRVFDPKGGQEYTDFEDAAWEYQRDPTKWTEFLEHAHRALSAKQAVLRAKGLRKVERPTEEFPLDVMLIDELLTALAFGGSRKVKVNGTNVSAEDAFMTYLSTCRSAGSTVLASAQLAQKEILGKVRGLFGYVTCLRIAPTEKELVDILLGNGASKAYPAHQLPQDERHAGIGYVSLPRGVVKYRAAFLTDRERHQVAKGVAAWTKRLRGGDEE